MANVEALDSFDLKILDALQDDATLSSAALAERVGLSQSPCWRRVIRLKQAGYIRDQVTRLDRRKLGFNTLVLAHVKLSAHGRNNLEDFSEQIARFPEVMECYAIMGSFDFFLKIVTRDIDAYEKFVFGTLSKLPAVQEINSAIALSEVKSTSALPLRTR
ncbi:MAG: AsnC family transcriptional regulator [Phenylobacterium sp.]|jgi:Lrp/AsnC family transcriptional regulator|nr:AsnC family transcriptional regulator [Phenylobacterium sp.]